MRLSESESVSTVPRPLLVVGAGCSVGEEKEEEEERLPSMPRRRAACSSKVCADSVFPLVRWMAAVSSRNLTYLEREGGREGVYNYKERERGERGEGRGRDLRSQTRKQSSSHY